MFETEDGEYTILSSNPAARMFKLRRKNPEKPCDRRIALDKLGLVWLELQRRRTAARTIDQRTAVDWVATMLLTGMRLTESASLKWTDLNLDAKTITLRGDVEPDDDNPTLFAGVKNHNEVTLPMSTLLHSILAERKAPAPESDKVTRRRRVQRASEYVFASFGEKTPYITGAPATFKAISKIAGPISAHDLRRTYEDICLDVKVDSDQRRLLLNHISGDVHAIHYSNNRNALQAGVEGVATHVTTAAKVAAAGNVVSLPLPAQRAAG
jgi:integrase